MKHKRVSVHSFVSSVTRITFLNVKFLGARMNSHLIAGPQHEEEKDVLFCFDALVHILTVGVLPRGPLWWRAQTQRRGKFNFKQK